MLDKSSNKYFKAPSKLNIIEKKHNQHYTSFKGYAFKTSECKPQQLTAIGNRLLDWFSVIMADSKKRRQHAQKSKGLIDKICTSSYQI